MSFYHFYNCISDWIDSYRSNRYRWWITDSNFQISILQESITFLIWTSQDYMYGLWEYYVHSLINASMKRFIMIQKIRTFLHTAPNVTRRRSFKTKMIMSSCNPHHHVHKHPLSWTTIFAINYRNQIIHFIVFSIIQNIFPLSLPNIIIDLTNPMDFEKWYVP